MHLEYFKFTRKFFTTKQFLLIEILFLIVFLFTACASTPPAPPNCPYTWTQLLLIGNDQIQAMNSVITVNEEQLIAVGQEGGWASVWRSEDSGENWIQAWDNSQSEEYSVMNDIILTGDSKLIALGKQGTRAKTTVWMSADGSNWTNVYESREENHPSQPSEMKAIVQTNSGFIAVGSDMQFLDTDIEWKHVAAVWKSNDGISWDRVTGSEEALQGPSFFEMCGEGESCPKTASVRMTDVITTTEGIVAVGWSNQGNRDYPCVWLSETGETWSKTWCPTNMLSDQYMLIGRPNAVIQSDNRLIAVGQKSESIFGFQFGAIDGIAWYSDDGGESWHQATDIENSLGGSGNQSLNDIVIYDQELVAIGYDTGREHDHDRKPSGVWKSTDGLSWSGIFSATERIDSLRDAEMRGVVQHGQKIVVVGLSRYGGTQNFEFMLPSGTPATSDYDAEVWIADSLSSWHKIPCNEALCGGKANQTLTDIVRSTDTNYGIVGFEESNGDRDGAVWWCSISQITGKPECSTVSTIGGAGNQTINSIAYGFGDIPWVLGGSDDVNGNLDAAIWTIDGTKISHPEIFGGDGDQEILRIARGSDYLVAVGRTRTATGYDGTIWYSSDGEVWELGSDEDMVTRFGGTADISIYDVLPIHTAGENQEFIVVGESVVNGVTHAEMWRSNGSPNRWYIVNSDALEGENQSIRSIIYGPIATDSYGLIAVGSGGLSNNGYKMGARWTSDDNGRTWSIHRDFILGSNLAYRDISFSVRIDDRTTIIGTEIPYGQQSIYGHITIDTGNDEWHSCKFGMMGRQQTVNSITSHQTNMLVVGSENRGGEINGTVWYFTLNPDFRP